MKNCVASALLRGNVYMLLEVVGLQCIRGYRALFSDLAFTLGAGQLLLVEGHNGSGKTTLLKTLAGLREPDAGQAAVTIGMTIAQ